MLIHIVQKTTLAWFVLFHQLAASVLVISCDARVDRRRESASLEHGFATVTTTVEMTGTRLSPSVDGRTHHRADEVSVFFVFYRFLAGEVLAWLSIWSEVQMLCIWSS